MRVIEIVTEGPQGPPGAQGEQGIQGIQGETGGGIDQMSYHHSQSVPSDTWVIVHTLAFEPNVVTVDSTGREVQGEVLYTGLGEITIYFTASFAGDAYLS